MTEEPNNPAVTDEEDTNNSFVWWVCMLPGLVAAGVFGYQFLQTRSPHYLGCAVVALAASVVFAMLIVGTSGSQVNGDTVSATASGDGSAAREAKAESAAGVQSAPAGSQGDAESGTGESQAATPRGDETGSSGEDSATAPGGETGEQPQKNE